MDLYHRSVITVHLRVHQGYLPVPHVHLRAHQKSLPDQRVHASDGEQAPRRC